MSKRIAVLTGGGHISVLNTGIAAIIERAKTYGWEVIGSLNGWRGMQEDSFVDLNLREAQIAALALGGGTVIRSSRTKPVLDQVVKTVQKRRIDALIAMGGDDTLGAAGNLCERYGIPVVGWPKTMDNDISKTYLCLGYPTAAYNAAKCIRESFDGAYSHNRIAIVTMFGRETDWVVAGGGGYGFADLILPAEQEYSLEDIYQQIQTIYDQNNGHAVIAVAEGAKLMGLESHVREEDVDEFGHYKLDPHLLAAYLGSTLRRLSKACTLISLTYQLRNGPPLAIDHKLAMEAGQYCVDMVAEGHWGEMASITLESEKLQINSSVPLEDAAITRTVKSTKYFDYDSLQVTEAFFKYTKPFLGDRGLAPGYSFSLTTLD